MQNNSERLSLLTRRSWAAMVAVAPLIAQVSSSPQQAVTPGKPTAADDVRKVSERLSQIEVPMSIEPAFTFHV